MFTLFCLQSTCAIYCFLENLSLGTTRMLMQMYSLVLNILVGGGAGFQLDRCQNKYLLDFFPIFSWYIFLLQEQGSILRKLDINHLLVEIYENIRKQIKS